MILLVGVSLGLFARTFVGSPQVEFPPRKSRDSAPPVTSPDDEEERDDKPESEDKKRFV